MPHETAGSLAMLHPQVEAYLQAAADWWAARDLPPSHRLPPARAREVRSELLRHFPPPFEPMEAVEDHELQARSGPRRVRIFKPATGHGGPLPVALYFHGGGYVLGSIEDSEAEARRLAARLPALVVSASYRLGPEHPFPAAIEDGYDALLWLAHNAGRYGGDPRRLMVGGTSAGAGVAAAVTRLAVVENGPVIALDYLFCPWLDLTLRERSVDAFAQGYNLDREKLEWFATCYLGSKAEAADPLISPARHPAPSGMPPTVILAAECDPLADEARTYAGRLEAAGTPVMLYAGPGMIHGFNELTHVIPEGERHLKPAEAAIRRMIREKA
ncbi:MAG TPA: alpha/beta hydrolase [Alphaproteobacteria bacterium]|nr:alpha/beta hydrolase [Alphaproteobacteria bacterium]